MLDWSKYANFTEAEMRCHCGCGKADMDAAFMEKLQALRDVLRRPLVITSGYRCAAYNRAVHGGTAHPLGKAADISTSRGGAFNLTKEAMALGFTGIGWQQHGDNRFVHIDTLTVRETDIRPAVWSYP